MKVASCYPQFAVQVSGSDFTTDEISLVRKAYDEATIIFAAASRGSGRSFVDHLVGTASGTLLGGGDASDVAAALVHAAYEQGDFGDWRSGSTKRHRQMIRSRLGSEVEGVVYRYHELGWGYETAKVCLGRIHELSDLDRRVLLIRVANALDDCLFEGLVVSNKQSLSEYSRPAMETVASIAKHVATPALVECLNEEAARKSSKISELLILGGVGSRVQVPLSFRRRRTIAIVRQASSLPIKARRRLGKTFSGTSKY